MTALTPLYLTETEWLTCTTPVDMLRFLYGRVSDRKLRLYVCALARHLAGPDEPAVREAIAVVERYVDRQAPLRSLHQAHQAGQLAARQHASPALALALAATASLDVARLQEVTAAAALVEADSLREVAAIWVQRRREQCGLLREIMGNLFRRPTIDPAWKNWAGGFVGRIAQTIYDEQRFTDMPQLADALRQAGCRDPVLLAHADSCEPHYRGCWLLDRLLERD